MKLTLGFSPCPNDTFIFDALVNKKIDTEGLEFETHLEDVETLNEWAMGGRLDITKLSFATFFQTQDKYVLLNSGSALGKGVGPLLVSKKPISEQSQEDMRKTVSSSTIAIPGIHTTANLLLSFAFPEAKDRIPMLFSEIEDAVCNEKVDLGAIIHENRFTYAKKGLHKVIDLGEYWEQETGKPIPLGGIVMKNSFDKQICLKVDQLIRKSLDYSFSTYPLITGYVKQHSQSMSEDVMRQHIDLYVNEFSLDLGKEGREAVIELGTTFSAINRQRFTSESSPLFL